MYPPLIRLRGEPAPLQRGLGRGLANNKMTFRDGLKNIIKNQWPFSELQQNLIML